MAEYAMALKNGKDIVHRTNQQTLEEAKKYFAKLKNLSLEKFNELFIVLEIKN